MLAIQSHCEKIGIRLYVTYGAPNSIMAVDNLNAIFKDLPDRCNLEIVDILKDPLRAIEDGILVTPTLVKFEPPPPVSLIGNLNEKKKVIDILGLGEYQRKEGLAGKEISKS
jgi:circadian clock protein KaiB